MKAVLASPSPRPRPGSSLVWSLSVLFWGMEAVEERAEYTPALTK